MKFRGRWVQGRFHVLPDILVNYAPTTLLSYVGASFVMASLKLVCHPIMVESSDVSLHLLDGNKFSS